VCILGVGLLGGSIGRALRDRQLASTVVGLCRDANKANRALQAGAIDEAFDSVATAASGADLVIACTPVQQIIPQLIEASRVTSPSALLTDVGSTKGTIVAQAETAKLPNFVASHPLAGSERSGVEYSTPDLLVGKLVILTPSESTLPEQLQRAERLWRSLGAVTKVMTAAEHDQALAVTSHLPHIVASALAGQTPMELGPMTASGWADSTRIASGNPEMWCQIIQENRGPVLHALKNFATIWEQWINAIESDDRNQLLQLLLAGKNTRDALGNRHSSG
jgi:prephenate dehydrogenase